MSARRPRVALAATAIVVELYRLVPLFSDWHKACSVCKDTASQQCNVLHEHTHSPSAALVVAGDGPAVLDLGSCDIVGLLALDVVGLSSLDAPAA